MLEPTDQRQTQAYCWTSGTTTPGSCEGTVAFSGYSWGRRAIVTVEYIDRHNQWHSLGTARSRRQGTTVQGLTGYRWDAAFPMPRASWVGCGDDQRAYVRARVGSQHLLSLVPDWIGCWADHGSNWSGFLPNCIAPFSPVARIKPLQPNIGFCGGTIYPPSGGCTSNAQCGDGNDCTQDLCVNNLCANPNKSNGTSCSGGANYVCEVGECLAALCEAMPFSCSGGLVPCQQWPSCTGGPGCGGSYTCVSPGTCASICFGACGTSIKTSDGAGPNFCDFITGFPNAQNIGTNPGIICDSSDNQLDCRPRMGN